MLSDFPAKGPALHFPQAAFNSRSSSSRPVPFSAENGTRVSPSTNSGVSRMRARAGSTSRGFSLSSYGHHDFRAAVSETLLHHHVVRRGLWRISTSSTPR